MIAGRPFVGTHELSVRAPNRSPALLGVACVNAAGAFCAPSTPGARLVTREEWETGATPAYTLDASGALLHRGVPLPRDAWGLREARGYRVEGLRCMQLSHARTAARSIASTYRRRVEVTVASNPTQVVAVYECTSGGQIRPVALKK